MARAKSKSEKLWKDAQRYIPGGVNSPVRAFKGVGGNPIFVDRGKGSKIWDADGKQYVDHVCSWGPLILGHAHPEVAARLKKVISKATPIRARAWDGFMRMSRPKMRTDPLRLW